MLPLSTARQFFRILLLALLAPVCSSEKKVMLLGNDILFTGSSYLYLASAAFQAYKNATGASVDPETKLLTISHAQFMQLEALNFAISGVCV